MVDLLTIEEVATELGIDTDLARNWCERGLIECANPSDNTYLVTRTELEELTEGIEPASRKQDRVELFSRVNEEPEEPEERTRTLDGKVYAKFSTRFERDPPAESSESDVTYYLDRYGMLTHRVADLMEPSSTPVTRTNEQLSKDIAELLKPLRGTSSVVGSADLKTALQGIDRLIDEEGAAHTYEIQTTVLRTTTGDGARPRLQTTLVVSDLRDGEAVAVPTNRGEREYPIHGRYLSEWQSELRSLVADRTEGVTFRCALFPSNCNSYRFEFRAAGRHL